MKEVAEFDTHSDDENAWSWFSAEVDYWFDKVFPKGEVGMVAVGHGWRGLSGYRDVESYECGSDAVSKALVSHASAKVYIRTNKLYGRHIAINTVHHDVPMWGQEWSFLVRPSKFNKLMKEEITS